MLLNDFSYSDFYHSDVFLGAMKMSSPSIFSSQHNLTTFQFFACHFFHNLFIPSRKLPLRKQVAVAVVVAAAAVLFAVVVVVATAVTVNK